MFLFFFFHYNNIYAYSSLFFVLCSWVCGRYWFAKTFCFYELVKILLQYQKKMSYLTSTRSHGVSCCQCVFSVANSDARSRIYGVWISCSMVYRSKFTIIRYVSYSRCWNGERGTKWISNFSSDWFYRNAKELQLITFVYYEYIIFFYVWFSC